MQSRFIGPKLPKINQQQQKAFPEANYERLCCLKNQSKAGRQANGGTEHVLLGEDSDRDMIMIEGVRNDKGKAMTRLSKPATSRHGAC